jgi:hypothetical protein
MSTWDKMASPPIDICGMKDDCIYQTCAKVCSIYTAVSKSSRISSVTRQQMAAQACTHRYSDLQS